ncbi:reductase [Actinorhabdospora filicis]|uniref:Reductase n=1 Tax=Actinorhabdospora filicis TaxID=1785913 RepID=A0A9W6SF78_9ACTN|nr:NAD-dependent epimerase/dehydratase family protein [Actinorhabdospora filicis]GLZ75213.1 reductase [Actinorhabdospora filicis]
MKILVLGGTRYLSHATAALAVSRGHDVTVAARGESGEPPSGTEFVRVDRATPEGVAALRGRDFDAVIDVARVPLHIATVLDALGEIGHYGFVSTVSVYTEHAALGGTPATTAIAEPTAPDSGDLSMELYGPSKVACENLLRERFGEDALIVRAGLIVGPADPGDRFGYWPWRIARGGEVLAPGTPEEPVQWIDVLDLAEWLVRAAEERTGGTHDGMCPPVSRGEFLTGIAAALGADVTFTWVPNAFLEAQEVGQWMGPESLPLWSADPGFTGFMARDTSASVDAGMRIRPLAETTRRWIDWNDGSPAGRAGLSPEREAAVLAAWHASA